MKPASTTSGGSSPVKSGEINSKSEIENASDTTEIETGSEFNGSCSPSKINQFFEGPLLYEDVLEDTNSLESYLSSVPSSDVMNDVNGTDETKPAEDVESVESHKIYSSRKSYFSEEKLNTLNAERHVVGLNSSINNESISLMENSDLSIENVKNNLPAFDPFQMEPCKRSVVNDDDVAVPSENKTINIELSVASSVPVNANKCKGPKKKGQKLYGRNVLRRHMIQNHTSDQKSYSKILTPDNCKSNYSKLMYSKFEEKKQLRVSLTDNLVNRDSKNYFKHEVNVAYPSKLTASSDVNVYKSNKNNIDAKTKAKKHNTNKVVTRKNQRRKSSKIESELNQTPKKSENYQLNSSNNSESSAEVENIKKCRGKRTPKQQVLESIPGPSMVKNTARKSFPQRRTERISKKKLVLDEAMSDYENEDLLKGVVVNKSHVQRSESKLTSQRFAREKETSFSGLKAHEKNNTSFSDFLSKSSASESCATPRSNFMQLYNKVAPKNSSEAPFKSDFIEQIFQEASSRLVLKSPRSPLDNVNSGNNHGKKKIQQTQLTNGNNVDQISMETLVQNDDMSASKFFDRSSIKKEPQSDSSLLESMENSRKRKCSAKKSDDKNKIRSNLLNVGITNNSVDAESSLDADDSEFSPKPKKLAIKGVKNSKIKVSCSSISLFEDGNSSKTSTSKQNRSVRKRKRCSSVPPSEFFGNNDLLFKEEQSDEISSIDKPHSSESKSANTTLELKKHSSSVQPHIVKIKTKLKTPSKEVENIEPLSREKQKGKKNEEDISFDESSVELSCSPTESNSEPNANSFEIESIPTPFNTQNQTVLPEAHIIYRLNPNCKVHYNPDNNSHFLSVPLHAPSLQEGLMVFDSPFDKTEISVSLPQILPNIFPQTIPYMHQVMPSIIAPQLFQTIGTAQGARSIANIQHSSIPNSVVLPVPSSSSSFLQSVKLPNANITSVSSTQAPSTHYKLNESTVQNGVILNNATTVSTNSVIPVLAVRPGEVLTERKQIYGETSRLYYQAGPNETLALVNSRLQKMNNVCNFNWEFIVRRRTEVDVPRWRELSQSVFGASYSTLTVENFCTHPVIFAGLGDLRREYISESDSLDTSTPVQFTFRNSFEKELMIQVLKDFVCFYLASVYRKIEGKRGVKLKEAFLNELYVKFPVAICSLLGVMLPKHARKFAEEDIASSLTMIAMIVIFHECLERKNKMPSIVS